MKTKRKTVLTYLGFCFLLSMGTSCTSETNQNQAQCTYNNDKQITVTAISDRVIHVQHKVKGQQDKKSLIVPEKEMTIIAKANSKSLRTNQVEVRLDDNTGKVSFFKANGDEIISESGRSVQALDVDEFKLYKTQQSWYADESEAYYGLGQFYESQMNYQGTKRSMRQLNRDAVFPLVVSSGGYAILWDVNCRSEFDATADGEISFSADSTFNFDYYLIYGPEYDTIVAEMRELTGRVPMFPRWALGYMQVRERYKTQKEVLDIASKFRDLEFPIDLIVQDWRYWGKDENNDYQHKWGGMIWEPTKFPDPEKMIQTLHDDLNMKFMAVIWPVIGDSTELMQELDQAGGMLNKRHGGSQSRLYDAYDEKMRDIYWKYAKKGIYDIGTDSWWMDGTEPVVPRDGFYTGNTVYGPLGTCTSAYSLVHCEGIYTHQRAENDGKRVFIITRSGYPGQQRAAAATWSGDVFANWESYEKSIASGVNYSITGMPWWTLDIGGWYSQTYLPQGEDHAGFKELYTRWFQYATFLPLFRSHGSKIYCEPWLYGDETMAILKDYTNLRYRLMPYTYTLASEVTRKHATIMRGLPMAFPEDVECRENGKQYMFGPSILVSPVFESRNGKNAPIEKELLYDKSGEVGGLSASYYAGQHFNKLMKKQKDASVDFFWSDKDDKAKLENLKLDAENLSVRWEGYYQTDLAGEYQFNLFDVKSNFFKPSARLWVNNQEILDYWDNANNPGSGTIKLPANSKISIKLEYKSNSARSNIYLKCTAPINVEKVNKMRQQVYLPQGTNWIDFWTGKTFTGGQTLQLPIDINNMPLHIKAGSILPMGPFLQYASEKSTDPIELRIYPGKDTEYTLYEDENDNYNYEQGQYSLIPISWNDKKQELTIGQRKGEFPGMLRNYKIKIVVVRENHGVGIDITENPDHLVSYDGEEMVINCDLK